VTSGGDERAGRAAATDDPRVAVTARGLPRLTDRVDAADVPPLPRVPARAPRRTTLAAVGTRSLRVAAWRERDDIALVATRSGGRAPDPAEILRLVAAAHDAGVTRLVTGALTPGEQAPFAAAGFTVHDRLHLLSHDLRDLAPTPEVAFRIRRAGRADHAAALAVDARAFEPFWRLDRVGLRDALGATASARFRVLGSDPIVGYAVIGRSGDRGYLQRLAVDPGHRRQGLGAALVLDGLRWLRRRWATSVVVNTQVGNDAALSLYRRLGFVLEPGGLCVLTRTTDP